MDYEKKYKEAIERMKSWARGEHPECFSEAQKAAEFVFPELKESEDERIRKELIRETKGSEERLFEIVTNDEFVSWLEKQGYTKKDVDDAYLKGISDAKHELEKQGESSDQIHYWTEEEIEPIINDYLRGVEHYGGMIGRLRCLKPKSHEKQGGNPVPININKMVMEYSQTKDGDFGLPVNCQIRAYRQGINDALNLSLNLEKQGNSSVKWQKNTPNNKPAINHSVLMKTIQGIAEGEWQGEHWFQYRWSWTLKDSDVLSWMELSDLDEQGEQKPILDFKASNFYVSKVDGKIHDMTYNPTNKVEPRFKVGDWVIDKQGIVHQIANVIENLTNHTYGYDIVGGGYFNDNTEGVRLWTIKDAKDGDMLYSKKHNLIWIYKDNKHYYASINLNYADAVSFDNGIVIPSDVCPANRVQKSILFQKMEEAGFEWDSEKLELKKIEDEIEIPFGAKDSELQEDTYYIPKGFHAEIDDDKVVIKKGEKSAAWSEEDENYLQSAENACEYQYGKNTSTILWLKHLKDRIGG